MAEAFRFYRDELKLHVYPVDGPWSKKADPGKKPAVAAWWNYDPKECDVAEFFKPQRCHNIGVCPTGKLYIVDLDSKTDQGKSVYEFIASKPALANIPRHRTRGGCHLVFFCDDVPPDQEAAEQQAIRQAALFPTLGHGRRGVLSQRSLRTLSFPRRPIRRCSNTSGRSWARSRPCPGNGSSRCSGSSFRERRRKSPKRSRRSPFTNYFNGDFKYLDLVKLAEALNLAPELLNAEDGKYAITCPWQSEHTETAQADIVLDGHLSERTGDGWPGFKCLHSHCEAREIKDVILWAESQEKGIVDSALLPDCASGDEGQTDPDGKPRILHPQYQRTRLGLPYQARQDHGRAAGLVRLAREACLLDNIRSGKIYIGEEEADIAHMPATVTGFKELEGIKARGHCESFCTPGYLSKDEAGNLYFIRESFSTEYCNAALEDPHLLAELPNPHRILTVPFPFLDPKGKKLIYPGPGYDPQFHTYMVKDAPEIDFAMPVKRAKEILAEIHEEFCFLNAQSKVHAYRAI